MNDTTNDTMNDDDDDDDDNAIPKALAATLPRGVDVDDCDILYYDDPRIEVCKPWVKSPKTTIVLVMPTWYASDGNWEEEFPYAYTGREAAEDYVSGGDWGEDGGTTVWVRVTACRKGRMLDDAGNMVELDVDEEVHRVAVEPREPDCNGGKSHDWQSPWEQCNGGGVVIREACARCGIYRITDTWARDSESGVEGLTSIYYEEADDASLEWVEAQED